MTGSDAVHMGNDVAGMLKQKEPDRQEIKQKKKIRKRLFNFNGVQVYTPSF